MTLLEVMVVIFIITLITGVVGYNLKGSMDKGRAFKTEQGIAQLHDLLLISVAEGKDINEVAKEPERFLKLLGLAKNPGEMVVDGWKSAYKIEVINNETDFKITSEKLAKYQKDHK